MPKNEAKAVVSLNSKPFVAGAKLAMDASKKMASVMKNAMGVATGVIVGGAALQGINKLAGGIQDLTSGGIGLAASMADLAAETDMAADEALKYDYALKNGLSNKAAEQLMGKAAKNIGSTAEVFRNLKIRLSAIWLNMQGVFAKLASFFAPVVDQILDMAESIDWDEWIASAKEWITPIRDGMLVVVQLVKERKIWEVAGKVMELGFAKAKNVLIHGFEVAQAMAPAIGPLLGASLKTVGNTIVYLGQMLTDVLTAAFEDGGLLFGKALWSGLLSVGSKIVEYLIRIFATPVAALTALMAKAISELIESLPDWAKPEGMKDFKAASLDELMEESLNSYGGGKAAEMFKKQGEEAAQEFKDAAGQLTKKVGDAAKSTEFKDYFGASESIKEAGKKFKDAASTEFKDKSGAGALQNELADIFKGALGRVKTQNKVNTKSIKGVSPVFGSADSLASVGGGGGVGTGLMGVLDEAKRQTRLQERMVDLLGNKETVTPSPPIQGAVGFAF